MLTLAYALSKITTFLVLQSTQQAVMKISLKMELPKLILATMTISSGDRFKFQFIGMLSQHSLLKGHSKNR
jgi:hypothetical protein